MRAKAPKAASASQAQIGDALLLAFVLLAPLAVAAAAVFFFLLPCEQERNCPEKERERAQQDIFIQCSASMKDERRKMQQSERNLYLVKLLLFICFAAE